MSAGGDSRVSGLDSYRFYVAGPLFNAYEQAYQAELAARLAPLGRVFLPQAQIPADAGAEEVFARCVAGIDASAVVVANLSGADADSGTAFEVGYAYARSKPVYALRSEMAYGYPDRARYPNLMLRGAARQLLASIDELVAKFEADYPHGG